MFVSLGQKRRGSASSNNNCVVRPPEEQLNEEQILDPLSYRLAHLNQRGCNSGDDVDPFDVGSDGSFSDDQLDGGNAVDDAGWGAKSNYNNGSDYDDDDCYQEGDGLFLDFGGRTPEQARPRRHQTENLSTPKFGGGGSQSTHSHWESTVEHSRRSLSTISCTQNDVSDGLADIERQCVEMISKNNTPESPYELGTPIEQTTATRSSGGQTSRKSISTLSTLSSPTDKCMRENITSADVPHSSLPPPPIFYKPVSRRSSSDAAKEEKTKDITKTDNSTFVEVSIVPQVEAQKEEECPRLEQLQQMTLEELKSELMTIQAQSKTNLENSWKAAERMRVENSELDQKAEGLKSKLEAAFKEGPPVSRRHTDSEKYDDYDLDEESDVNAPIDGREGMLRQSLSDKKLIETRRSVSGAMSSAPWPEEGKDDSINDVIEAFTLDLDTPSGNLPLKNNNVRQIEGSFSGDSSSDFGFVCLDMQSAVKTPLASNTSHSHRLDRSDGSDDLKSGVYYPPPVEEEEEEGEMGDSVSTPQKMPGDNAAAPTDNSGAKGKPGFKRRATIGEDSQTSQGSSGIRAALKRRPSMLVRRKSFRGFFGLNESTTSAQSEISSVNLDNSNTSAAFSIEPLLNINANVFQVEARSIMIEELENELKEKGEIVTNMTGEVEGQKEEINNCELEITRIRKQIDDEYEELARAQSVLQQSVKELIQWDSAIESRLDQTEGRRQRLKQQEKDLKVKLELKEPTNVSDSKIELERQRSRCKDEYKASQEKSSASLSMVINSLRAMECDSNLEQRSKQLLDSFDTQTNTLLLLLGNSDRVASFTTLKEHIEAQRDLIINASDKLFRSETDLRGNLIRLKLNLEGSDECSHIMESSIASEFTESVLAHIVEAREEHARFLLAAVTRVDDYLSWWDGLLDANSTLKDCEEQGDAFRICAILEHVLADVTEELAAAQAKIDEAYSLFQSNLLSAGLLDQSQKLSTNKESNVETSDHKAELDNLNEQVHVLEASISEQLAIRKDYASTLDQLYDRDEADSKANLELLDNIQAQVKLLAKKLATDDDKISSLRQSLREKKERVVDLEYGKKRRDIVQT